MRFRATAPFLMRYCEIGSHFLEYFLVEILRIRTQALFAYFVFLFFVNYIIGIVIGFDGVDVITVF